MAAIPRLMLALLLPVLTTVAMAELADDFNIPKGWRMQDRFHGFRYEAVVDQNCPFYAEGAQESADELACFGWVQRTQANTFVGEARCSKATGAEMQERLRRGPGHPCKVLAVEVKDYEDTKIKLHFSHFKILEKERMTCFRDTPHQCPEFSKKDPPVEYCGEGGCEAASADEGTASYSID